MIGQRTTDNGQRTRDYDGVRIGKSSRAPQQGTRAALAFISTTFLATFTFAVERAFGDSTLFADLTGDGIAETISAQPAGSGMTPTSGRVIVYDGASGAALLFVAGESTGDEFGASVAALNDQNHDGLPELAIGAPGAPSRGAAYVFRSPLSAEYTWISAENAEFVLHAPDLEESLGADRVLVRFGESVAAFYDMDSDGAAEFRVGCLEIDTTNGSIRHAAGIFEGQIGVQIAHAVVTVNPLSQFTDPFAGLRCDVGKDGTVSIDDVLAVIAQLGSEEFVDEDVDGDGRVTAVDLLAVTLDVGRQSIGMIPDGPREVGDSIFGTWTRSIVRDDGVEATAETIGNGMIGALLRLPLVSPSWPWQSPDPDSLTPAECLASLESCGGSELDAAIEAVNFSCGGELSPVSILLVCREPDGDASGANGVTRPQCQSRSIEIWIRPLSPTFTPPQRCMTLAHELWHVAQACASGFNNGNCEAFGRRWDNPLSCACNEWFAYHETGAFATIDEFCHRQCTTSDVTDNICVERCVSALQHCVWPGVYQQ